jgi:DNA-binding phage protein
MATVEQIEVAISWLDANEGEGAESEACQATIKLLASILDRRAQSKLISDIARDTGRSRGEVRKHLKAKASLL